MNQGLYFAEMTKMRKLAMLPKFRSRFFSNQEMKFLMSKNFPEYTIGEMFCGKLAFKKAMGTQFMGCKLNEVSILADYSGSYYISLCGHTKLRLDNQKRKAYICCAHNKMMVMSMVNIE